MISLRFQSNCNMIEVAQFLSSEGGWKSEESGFNFNMIKINELIGKLFNRDKFPLLLEVNEKKRYVIYYLEFF